MSDQANSSGFIITEKEIKSIRRSVKGRVVFDAVNNMRHQLQFEIGDVLVLRLNNDRLLEVHEGVPQRFFVVHKDDLGFIYTKKILTGGKLGQGLELLAVHPSGTRFEIDPEKVESILVGQEGEYNPYAQAKELKRKKDKQRKANKALKLSFKDIAEADKFLQQLKVGDKLYRTYTLTDSKFIEIDILSITKAAVSTQNRYGYEEDGDFKKAGIMEKTEINTNISGRGTNPTAYAAKMTAKDLINAYSNYYKDKPLNTEDVI